MCHCVSRCACAQSTCAATPATPAPSASWQGHIASAPLPMRLLIHWGVSSSLSRTLSAKRTTALGTLPSRKTAPLSAQSATSTTPRSMCPALGCPLSLALLPAAALVTTARRSCLRDSCSLPAAAGGATSWSSMLAPCGRATPLTPSPGTAQGACTAAPSAAATLAALSTPLALPLRAALRAALLWRSSPLRPDDLPPPSSLRRPLLSSWLRSPYALPDRVRLDAGAPDADARLPPDSALPPRLAASAASAPSSPRPSPGPCSGAAPPAAAAAPGSPPGNASSDSSSTLPTAASWSSAPAPVLPVRMSAMP